MFLNTGSFSSSLNIFRLFSGMEGELLPVFPLTLLTSFQNNFGFLYFLLIILVFPSFLCAVVCFLWLVFVSLILKLCSCFLSSLYYLHHLLWWWGIFADLWLCYWVLVLLFLLPLPSVCLWSRPWWLIMLHHLSTDSSACSAVLCAGMCIERCLDEGK